jgi:DNA-binding NtrC family response regulator
MSSLQLLGDPLPASLLRALRERAVPLHDPQGAPVVMTRKAVLPARVPSRPFVWCVGADVPGPMRRAAVLRGAVDVVDVRDVDALARIVERAEELAVRDEPLPHVDEMVLESTAARALLAQIVRAARTSMTVLLTGETGTGKELAARLLHKLSRRAERPFVPINCAAIPNELMEAELFGYARGAFSGAVQRFDGQLVSGEHGTVFLDEIDDTPMSTQMKLLRVLEDHVVTRLGESSPRKVDFRIVAASNRDLRGLIDAGIFAPDLYERLAWLTIRVPPLRERTDDIERLVLHFMERYQREAHGDHGTHVTSVDPDALDALRAHPWPGNIRELRNVVVSALVEKRAGRTLLLSDLPRRVLLPETGTRRMGTRATSPVPAIVNGDAVRARMDAGQFDLVTEVETLERTSLLHALARGDGSATEAARLLGRVGRGTARDPSGTVRAMRKRLLPQ